jgi:hypothetical protein
MQSNKLMLLTAVGSAIAFYDTLWVSVCFVKHDFTVDSLWIVFLTAFMASFSFMLLVIQLVIFCREFCKFLASDDR